MVGLRLALIGSIKDEILNIDELSLALALKEDSDERVEEAVEEMLNDLWRRIDGHRN